jgi:hypothetical protein
VDEIHAVERHTHHILVVFWVIFVHACGGWTIWFKSFGFLISNTWKILELRHEFNLWLLNETPPSCWSLAILTWSTWL